MKILRIKELSAEEKRRILERSMIDISSVYDEVRRIIEDVRKRGNKAIEDQHERFFGEKILEEELEVKKEEIEDAYRKVDPEIIESLKNSARNIKVFHEAQLEKQMWIKEVERGILAGRMTVPIEKVGCYVPGGRAIYPSSLLMTAIPAKVAGVKEVIVTTPPKKGKKVDPLILVSADIAGVDRIFKIGGPWAIAALAFGTETVPKVEKIVGPGNIYVTAAKLILYGKVSIDLPAGPSEILIIADKDQDPKWIATDLLSQLEHDPDSSAVLITDSEKLANDVYRIIEKSYERLPRKDILSSSLKKYSYILISEDLDEAIRFANEYAPEHIQIMTKDPFLILPKIRNAGSIFLGPYSPVPAGDYASGTNHVLPTGGSAKGFSGLSVDDFLKRITFQYITKQGLMSIKDTVIRLAEKEGLPLHAQSIKIRFRDD